MPSLKNKDLKESYQKLLTDNPEFMLSRYSGLTVSEITQLRKKLREKSNYSFLVIKNNVFKLVLEERKDIKVNWGDILVGPIAVVFAKSKLTSAAKILKDYSKGNQNVKILSGVMDSYFYDQTMMESLANLPSREELLAQVASSLQAPVTKIAGGMKEIMSSLSRAIKAVGEKSSV